jgi:hypothetical protein
MASAPRDPEGNSDDLLNLAVLRLAKSPQRKPEIQARSLVRR